MNTNLDQKIAQLFDLDQTTWERHANPWSVWTRFLSLPPTHFGNMEPDMDRRIFACIRDAHDSLDLDKSAPIRKTGLHEQLGFKSRSRRADLD